MKATRTALLALTVIVAAALLYLWGHTDGRTGKAIGLPGVAVADEGSPKFSPVKARDRDFYTPNSEDLGPNEMRLIACGTGMPTARPKQAASCWLLELGNGDKFLFDVGTGSNERIAAFQIPYNYLDKVFLSHLHTDHFGDLDALFIGGALSGRQKPLRVWGVASFVTPVAESGSVADSAIVSVSGCFSASAASVLATGSGVAVSDGTPDATSGAVSEAVSGAGVIRSSLPLNPTGKTGAALAASFGGVSGPGCDDGSLRLTAAAAVNAAAPAARPATAAGLDACDGACDGAREGA